MDKSRCVRLPKLHCAEPYMEGRILSLWPGHGIAGQEYWQPEDYALSREEAKKYLAYLNSLPMHELENLRMSMAITSAGGLIREFAEKKDIDFFAGRNTEIDPYEYIKKQAQMLLLWQWHLENLNQDIEILENKCGIAESMISSLFNEDSDMEVIHNLQKIPIPLPWKGCVINALFFIPEDMPILLEYPANNEAFEFIDFHPVENDSNQVFPDCFPVLRAIAPLWQIIGNSKPLQCADKRINSIFNNSRIWYIREDA